MNLLTISGRVGGDPEMRMWDDKPVTSFSVAVNGYKKDDKPTWFKSTVWGRQAEACKKYLMKGSQVIVTGELKTEEWVDKDKKDRYTLCVNASNVEFIGGKPEEAPQPNSQSAVDNRVAADAPGIGDIPF